VIFGRLANLLGDANAPFVISGAVCLYVSPVGFSSAIVPEKWQLLYALNPMVGVSEGFRWAIIVPGAFINPLVFGMSIAIVALLLVQASDSSSGWRSGLRM
jgi:lipopolysaccharide transport system permease protein